MNWPCDERACKLVFVRTVLWKGGILGAFHLQTSTMIDACRNGVLDLDVCIFALSEYSDHDRRLFVYQNECLLNLNDTSPFPAHTSTGSNDI